MIRGSYYNGFAPRDGMPLYPSLWKGCVGAWAACLGPTGLTLRDWSGYGQHGTLTNMAADSDWVLNAGAYSIDLDGTNDYVDIADSPSLSALSAISVSAWVNIRTLPAASTGNRMWIVTKGNTSNFEWELSISSFDAISIPFRKFVFTSYNLSAATSVGRGSSTTATTASWIHVLASQTAKSATPSIYVNGVLDNGATELVGTPTVGDGTANVQIGRRANASDVTFNGQIDDVRIYNRALNPNEIALLARRRGIAYDMMPMTMPYSAAGFQAAWALRQRLILGGGGGLG